jgi:hypothetical protein
VITVFWDVISCSLVDRYHCCGKPAASIFRVEAALEKMVCDVRKGEKGLPLRGSQQ